MRRYRKFYRLKKKKSIFRNRFFGLTILILIFFFGLFYFLVFSTTFQIKEIKISGNQKVSTESLENFIREKISQQILFFSSKNIFLINLNKINEAIFKKFPQVVKVNFKRNLPNTLIVKIEERKPTAIFCQNETCFFIDKEGIIFEEIIDFKPQQLVVRNITLLKELKLGEEIVEKELISQILEIESKIKNELKIPLNEILIVSEDKLNFKTSESWEIYFNPQKDINWQLTKLRLVLEKEIPLEKRKNLEYIELRFGNFAYPKYR